MVNSLSQAEQSSALPFKDCFFIGKNLSAVQLVFEDFNEYYEKDNCSVAIEDENIANNVSFVKLSGYVFDTYYDSENKQFQGQNDLEEISNKFPKMSAFDISNNSKKLIFVYLVKSFSFKDLHFINVSHSQVIIIPDNLFSEMQKLTEIDLSFNRIVLTWDYPFRNLTELKVLDLRNNRIHAIEDPFENNKKLELLRLENNPIKTVKCEAFELLERSVLIELSWNSVTSIHTNCEKTKLKISVENDDVIIRSLKSQKEMRTRTNNFGQLVEVYFGANQLINASEILDILGSSLKVLRIRDNSIGKLNTTTFHQFTELQTLHLDRTNLSDINGQPFKNMQKLLELRLSGNNLKKLNVDSFKGLKAIEYLSLDRSNLSQIVDNPFKDLKNVSSLDISGNHLTWSNLISLNATLMNLKRFSVAENNLVNIQEIMEYLGSNLASLDVSHNFIGKLNAATFERNKKLWFLNLAQTNLTEFDGNPFENLTQLSALDISNNNLKKFNATIFSSTLEKLWWSFNVSGNKIENVKEITRHLNSSLYTLDMSGNYVGKIEEDTFEELNLFRLVLRSTNLTQFDIKFMPRSRLFNLDISHNGLTSANFTSEATFERLEKLNVNWNGLTELKGLNNKTYPKLKLLHIEGNHLTCEYLGKLKWDELKIVGDPCDKRSDKFD